LVLAGADPRIGRKLRALFAPLMLSSVRVGVLGGEWGGPTDQKTRTSEQQTLVSDLRSVMDQSEIETLLQHDADAWELGERILFVPTFYAVGKVSKD
jgi:hypothetical protein